jgi:hypothetical protein
MIFLIRVQNHANSLLLGRRRHVYPCTAANRTKRNSLLKPCYTFSRPSLARGFSTIAFLFPMNSYGTFCVSFVIVRICYYKTDRLCGNWIIICTSLEILMAVTMNVTLLERDTMKCDRLWPTFRRKFLLTFQGRGTRWASFLCICGPITSNWFCVCTSPLFYIIFIHFNSTTVHPISPIAFYCSPPGSHHICHFLVPLASIGPPTASVVVPVITRTIFQCITYCSTLKMEAASSSETLVTIYEHGILSEMTVIFFSLV